MLLILKCCCFALRVSAYGGERMYCTYMMLRTDRGLPVLPGPSTQYSRKWHRCVHQSRIASDIRIKKKMVLQNALTAFGDERSAFSSKQTKLESLNLNEHLIITEFSVNWWLNSWYSSPIYLLLRELFHKGKYFINQISNHQIIF